LMTPELREKMGAASIRLAESVGYTNAGTMEFLVDDAGKFYFMEMNTRIQVEHPVTEMVTRVGRDRTIDLVEEQIRVAAGEKLRWRQKDIISVGHAIEMRINAEDPERNFAPCPGKVNLFVTPEAPHLRVDSALYSGYRIPPYYDSLIAKLIVHGANRAEAIERAKEALANIIVDGVHTTIPFHRKLLTQIQFVQNDYDINFVDQHMV
ncbi:MAG: acetyl-CoA carboxylase biotin carboxylase subunit, partial [Planctomycetota bacterium]|nr:acetyl-CoA carboxylase biotin carboxylase subunit [Planctomycetota bacterium]